MSSTALEAFVLILFLATVVCDEIIAPSSQGEHAQEKHRIGSPPVFYGGWALRMAPCPPRTYSVGAGCCPEGTTIYTPHMHEDPVETLCCPDGLTQDECLRAVESLQTCADSSWNLWINRDGFRFCCQNGDIGHTGARASGAGDDGSGDKCAPGRKKRSPQDLVATTLAQTRQTTMMFYASDALDSWGLILEETTAGNPLFERTTTTTYYPSRSRSSGTETATSLETPTDIFTGNTSVSETATSESSSSRPRSNRRTIIGVAIAIICAFIGILGFAWRCYKRRKNRPDSTAAEIRAPFPVAHMGQATANAQTIPAAGMSGGQSQQGIYTWQLVYHPPVSEAAGVPVSEMQAGDHPNAHEMQA